MTENHDQVSTGGTVATFPTPSVASERLLAMKPEDTDRYLVRMVQQIPGLRLVPKTNPDTFAFERYLCQGVPTEAAALERAIDTHERACLPAPIERLLAELSGLAAITVQQSAADETQEMQISMFARALLSWPGDVAIQAIQTWPRVSKFWPAWKEMQDHLEAIGGKRLSARDALQRAKERMEQEGPGEEAPETHHPTPEERNRVKQKIERLRDKLAMGA